MSDILPYRPFPRGPLIGAGVLLTAVILTAALGRHIGSSTPPAAASVAARDLRFEDRADGAVAVLDARDGRQVDVAAAGTNGFLRATMRGLARERALRGVEDRIDAPFRLTAWSDGRVTLDDPSTGRHVELEAFGRTNEEAFARLLTAPGGAK